MYNENVSIPPEVQAVAGIPKSRGYAQLSALRLAQLPHLEVLRGVVGSTHSDHVALRFNMKEEAPSGLAGCIRGQRSALSTDRGITTAASRFRESRGPHGKGVTHSKMGHGPYSTPPRSYECLFLYQKKKDPLYIEKQRVALGVKSPMCFYSPFECGRFFYVFAGTGYVIGYAFS